MEPNEAQLFIGLTHALAKDWYVVREERKKRLTAIQSVAKAKEEVKKNPQQVDDHP